MLFFDYTLPETNMAPENGWLEDGPFLGPIFRVYTNIDCNGASFDWTSQIPMYYDWLSIHNIHVLQQRYIQHMEQCWSRIIVHYEMNYTNIYIE